MITVKISKNPELLACIENQKIKISRKKTMFVPMIILHYFCHCFNQTKTTSPAAKDVRYVCNLTFLNSILG